MTHNSGSGQSNQFYFAIHVNGVEQTAPQKDGNGNYDWQENGFVQLVKTFSQGDYIDLRGQVSTGTGTTNYKFNGCLSDDSDGIIRSIMMATIHSKIEEYLGRTPDWNDEVLVSNILDGKGLFIDVWNIKDKPKPTTEQLDALDTKAKVRDDQKELENVRIERNRLLAETDWMCFPDSPTMSDAWKKYRQDLRDITKTATSLDDVK